MGGRGSNSLKRGGLRTVGRPRARSREIEFFDPLFLSDKKGILCFTNAKQSERKKKILRFNS